MDIGQWLKDWSTPLSALGTLAAVIVALGLGLASIIQPHRLQKRERKERLLNEILEWAADIHKSSLEVQIPFIDMSRIRELEAQGYPTKSIDDMKEGLKNQVDTYVNYQNLMAHGKAVSMNEYIKAIVKETFEKELLIETINLGNALVIFLFAFQRLNMRMEYNNAKTGFEGVYLKLIDEVNQKIQESKDTVLLRLGVFGDIVLSTG